MSFPTELNTDNEKIRLIAPDIERDSELSVNWLSGEIGKNTLILMGNVPGAIPDPRLESEEEKLERERKRVSEFLNDKAQLNWMIEFDGQVVGTVWVEKEPKDSVPSPSIHIMIGDPRVRGKSVGFTASSRVVKYLEKMGEETIYSRHLAKNTKAKDMLHRLGFKNKGEPYTDHDDLKWQNVER